MLILTATLHLAATCAVAIQSASPGKNSFGHHFSSPSVVVTSVTEEGPLERVEVILEAAPGDFIASTDGAGYAVFPGLAAGDTTGDPKSSGRNERPAQERVLVRIDHEGHVPLRVTRPLAEGTKTVLVRLTPLSAGFSTGLIDKLKGARVEVPNVGELLVPAKWLREDATVHVVPLGLPARSDSPDGLELVDQFWIALKDRRGEWIEAPAGGGQSLLLTRSLQPHRIPAKLHGAEEYRSVLSSHRGKVLAATSFPVPRTGKAAVPVGLGLNSVTRGIKTRGGLAATRLELREVSSIISPGASTTMLCGIAVDTISSGAGAGQSISTMHKLYGEDLRSAGFTRDSAIAVIGGMLGVECRPGPEPHSVLSTLHESSVSVTAGATLRGGACFNAEVVAGVVLKTYAVSIVVEEVDPGPPGLSPVKEVARTPAGTITVPQGGALWWNGLRYNPDCHSCGQGEPRAPDLPGQ